MIDYGSASLLEPAVLLGAMIGVYLNTVCPAWLVVLLLGGILSVVSVLSFRKGTREWKEEKKKRARGTHVEASELERMRVKTEDDITVSVVEQASKNEDDEDEREKTLAKVERRASRTFPWDFIGILVIAWIIIFVIALLRGSCSTPSMIGIQMCSVYYWILVLMALPLLGAVGYGASSILRHDHEKKNECSYIFAKGEIQWTGNNLLLFPFLCMLSGITTSLLGIGGGMLLSPMLLALGMTPDVTAATSAYTILFTESSIGIQFILLGMMQLDYAAALLILGFISALLGRFVVGNYLKKYNRSSIMIFIVAVVIAVSAILMTVVGVIKVLDRLEAGGSMGFRPLCC